VNDSTQGSRGGTECWKFEILVGRTINIARRESQGGLIGKWFKCMKVSWELALKRKK